MSPAAPSPTRLVRLQVALARPAAHVELLGETADWLTPVRLLEKDSRFEFTAALPEGVYAYKLRVDGSWMLDPGNPRTRSSRGDRNNLLVVGGTPEPVVFAPSLPFVFQDERGLLCVTAALRRGHGDTLRVRWREEVDDTEHVTTMALLTEEDEHRVVRAALPTSTSPVRVRFELADGSLVGADAAHHPFVLRAQRGGWPRWWPGSVLYTIFVDRFRPAADSPQWGPNPGIDQPAGGHLDGVRRSLHELRDLGVTVLYLTPIHVAATCHRYDVVDPFRVDPALGGEASLRALVDEAHALGLRIMLDFSFAHAGRGFPPLEDVLANGRSAVHASWFQWDNGDPPTLRQYGRRTDAPLLDLDHVEVRRMVVDAARFWAGFGIDGLRLDAAAEVPHELAREVRHVLKAIRPDGLLLGEVVPAHAWRWRQEGSVDAAYDFGFQSAVSEFVANRSIDAAEAARRLVEGSLARGGPESASLRFLSTHDHPRFATLARMHNDPGRVALGLLLLATCQGVPALLYGEELGLAADVLEIEPEHAWQDRAPMPWDSSRRDHPLKALVRRLLALRSRSPALLRGDFTVVFAAGPWLVVRRQAGGEVLDIAVNASDEAVALDLEDDRLDMIEPLAQVGPVRVTGQSVALGANAAVVARRSISQGTAKARRAFDGNTALAESEFQACACEVRSRPRRIDFSLTERCNLRCHHCINDSPHRTRERTARSMTEGVLERLREDLVFADYVGFVHGGESLTSPLFFDVLAAIRKEKHGLPYTVHLLSNGMMLTPEAVHRFVELGGNSLSVSIDGATAASNDAVRAGGRFEVIVGQLRQVVRFRQDSGADLRIGISCVVLNSNLAELPAIADLAADIGVDWLKLEELVSKSEYARGQLPGDDDARAAVHHAIVRGKARGLVMVDHTAPPDVWRCRLDDAPAAREFLAADEFANRSRIDPCRAPWEHACIDPNGDVRIADFWGPVIGNLAAEDLASVWSGPLARTERLRALATRPCGARCPGCGR